MTRAEKINTNFSLSYSSREDKTNDTVMDVNISFENPKTDSDVIHRLNTWLKAIGYTSIVVSHVELKKGV